MTYEPKYPAEFYHEIREAVLARCVMWDSLRQAELLIGKDIDDLSLDSLAVDDNVTATEEEIDEAVRELSVAEASEEGASNHENV